MAKYSIPSNPRQYTTGYTNFLGVDLNGDDVSTAKTHFPYAQNLDFDKKGFIEKRPGVKQIYNFGSGQINAIKSVYSGEEKLIVCAGSGLYEYTDQVKQVRKASLMTKSITSTITVSDAVKDVKYISVGINLLNVKSDIGIKYIACEVSQVKNDTSTQNIKPIGEYTGSYFGGIINQILTVTHTNNLLNSAKDISGIYNIDGNYNKTIYIPYTYPANKIVNKIEVKITVSYYSDQEFSGSITASFRDVNKNQITGCLTVLNINDYSQDAEPVILNDGKCTIVNDSYGYFVKAKNSYYWVKPYGAFEVSEICTSPTIIIQRNVYKLKPSNGSYTDEYEEPGTAFMKINGISNKVSESFCVKKWKKRSSEDTAAYFNNILTLSYKAKNIESIKYLSTDGTWLTAPINSYNIDTNKTEIWFKSSEATVNGYTLQSSGFDVYTTNAGSDNIVITYYADIPDFKDILQSYDTGIKYCHNFDEKLFFSGDAENKNYVRYSYHNDFTYFPDLNYIVVGAPDIPIMGFTDSGNTLVALKSKTVDNCGVYYIYYDNISGENVYRVERGISGIGTISDKGITSMNGNTVFVSDTGIISLDGNRISNISYRINKALIDSDLSECVLYYNKDRLYIAVDDNLYILYTLRKTYLENFDAEYTYEAMIWNGFSVRNMCEYKGEVFFSSDNGLFKFKKKTADNDTDYYCDTFINALGEIVDTPINSLFFTVADDDGSFMLLKTVQKRGSGIMIKPYTRSSAKIYVITNSDKSKLIKEKSFSKLDFEKFYFDSVDFSTNETVTVIPFNTKIKKYSTLQFMIQNDKIGEGFGVYGIEKRYIIGNYIKNN